jgi:hypothetical protein
MLLLMPHLKWYEVRELIFDNIIFFALLEIF